MSRMPSTASLQQFDRKAVHLGFIDAVELLPGGTNPGPASKMVYSISCNDIPGTLTRCIPSVPRWPDEWDVDALEVGTPVGVHVVRGQIHILARESRHAEDCA